MPDGLQTMFTAVPRRYDRVNRIVTLGLDQGWRRKAAKRCLEGSPRRILDLCAGTGDMSIALAKAAPPGVEIVAGDFVEPMLVAARGKARLAGVEDRIRLKLVDAGDMPFEDGAFDVVTIAFGFRNLTHENPRAERHLAEMARVVADGGRVVVVESSQPKNALVRTGFRVFLKGFVGPVGALISREPGAYRYLTGSVRDYLDADGVKSLLESADFDGVEYSRLLGGAAAIHWGRRRATDQR